MKETALVIIKPDALVKGLMGNVLLKFSEADLQIIGMKAILPTREQVEEHYQNIKGRSFFRSTVDFFMGKFHNNPGIIAIAYYGTNAIAKCRRIAGATNPEEASARSIRGAFGRVTTNRIYENVVHVSSSKRDARREIKLWFEPGVITKNIYPTKWLKLAKYKVRVWA